MSKVIHPETRIGHVHLRVADLERAIRFYNGVLGFEVTMRLGDSAAFLSAGGLSPSHWIEYLGKPWRLAAGAWDDRAVSCGDPLSLPR